MQQRRVPALERGDERLRVADPARHRQRLRAQREHALLGGREVQRVGQPRPQPRAQRRVVRPEPLERLLEQRDPVAVDDPGLRAPPRVAERRQPELVREALAARDPRRLGERPARRRIARARLGVAEPEQQVAAPQRVDVEPRLQRLQRAPVVAHGLLEGEHRHGLLGRQHRVVDRLAVAIEVARLVEVVRELGRRGVVARREPLQRLADRVVQPHPARGHVLVVERLAHQRVGEHEAVDVVLDLADQPGVDRLLQGRDQPLDRLVDQRVEDLQAELAADHRGHRQRLHGRRVEALEPARDHLLDALGDAVVAVGVRAHELLDEERVAVGVRVQARRDGGVGPACPHQRLGLARVEPAQRDPLERRLAAQPREQLGQLLAALLPRLAHRRDDQQLHRLGVLQHVREQQHGRGVGPLQVVEDQHHRVVARDEREQSRDRREQPEAVALPARPRSAPAPARAAAAPG